MTKPTKIVEALHDAADEASEGDDGIRADSIVDHVNQRGIGALLLVPGAIEITPIGGVPGVPTVLAAITALCAVQVLIGREDLWLPGFLARRTVTADRLHRAADWMDPVARWMDRNLGDSLTWLVAPPVPRLAALAILALCATVPALELVPFASTIPMGTCALFGLALLTRDGRVMALAWVATAGAVAGIWALWP
jgi:hypothetical protein